MKAALFSLLLLFAVIFTNPVVAQTDTCGTGFQKISVASSWLNETRPVWIALPRTFDPSQKYPVLYVLDAEWRFELVRHLMTDLAGNKKVPPHIIVGIPHLEMNNKRSKDLTFSVSKTEYDGDTVSWYHADNSGGAMNFYHFLEEEVIPAIDSLYPATGKRGLVGHSLGGYFGAYILQYSNAFDLLQIYDPSIWWSNGEVTEQLKKHLNTSQKRTVHITYQPVPSFHASKIEELIGFLNEQSNISLTFHEYKNETHMSLFVYSFLDGMEKACSDWKMSEISK